MFVGSSAVVLCYVDDLIICAPAEESVNNLMEKHKNQFRIINLEKASRSLELDLNWGKDGLMSFS